MLRTTAVLLFLGHLSAAEMDWPAKRAAIGHQDKLRVLVDKVLSKSNRWVMTEKHMDEIRDASFNVICPRVGGTDMTRVHRVAEMARRRGMFYMAWMRGTRSTKTGCKLVWSNGGIQDLYSPNADELWDWMAEIILGHARLSVELPNIVGSFLDYENYAKGPKGGNCYSLSYDEKIIGEFAKAKGIGVPSLAPAERAPWLDEHGHADAFRAFQIDSWRQRARKLRKQIDAINPRFQLIIYPAPGTLLMTEALYPEWATEQAPLILADASTYGRGWVWHKQGLEGNRNKLAQLMQLPIERKIPHLYMGGIDPVVRGADPEFSGKNAAMICELTNGYWIFYEGPTYGKPDHAAHFDWFSRANHDVAASRFGLWREPRETPDTLGATEVVKRTDKPQIVLYSMKKRMHQQIEEEGTFEVHPYESMPTLAYFKNFDVIVLQNFNESLEADDPTVKALRQYVQEGGGLFLVHDTGWFMASPFPEIAVRGYPKHKVEAVRHVVDRKLVVSRTHPALGAVAPGTEFTTEFNDHMIFVPGPKGTTFVKNAFGDPVYVAGQCGKGRVVFSGSYYGYWQPLSDPERDVFFAILQWLKQ